jgi:hypothetical protein
METKRCPYCQKLSPAYATVCSRCGRSFSPPSSPSSWRRGRVRRSIPPASPHRAGYHAGLHPEDQPDLSSLLPVPSSPLWEAPPPGEVRETPPTRRPGQEPQRIILQAQELLLPPREASPKAPADAEAAPPAHQGGPLATLLPLFCLLVLAFAGLLSYLVIDHGPSTASPAPVLTVIPRELRINDSFTLTGSGFGTGDELDVRRDGSMAVTDGSGQQLHVRVNAAGTFSLQLTITAAWQPGEHQLLVIDQARLVSVSTTLTVLPTSPAAPQLQLSDYDVYLGADRPGATTRLAITLLNSGGGQLTWQAASDRSWLNVTPLSGRFSGSESVTLTVNRAQLGPGDYTGHVTFRQQSSAEQGGTAIQQVLTVRMTVLPTPASLSIAPASLTYTASATQNPPAQTVLLQNSGGETVTWSSSVTTGAGGSWLSVVPGSGQLAPGAQVTLSVAVTSTGLAPGSYQGTVAFQGGTQGSSGLQLTVMLNVVAPGSLVVTPPTLSFSATAGRSPADQSLTLQNSGGLPLQWTLSASTEDGGPWLTAMPSAGQLAANASATVTVRLASAGLAAGAYQGRLLISAGGLTKTVAVSLTVNPPAAPAAPAIILSPPAPLSSAPPGGVARAPLVGAGALCYTLTRQRLQDGCALAAMQAQTASCKNPLEAIHRANDYVRT